MMDRVLQCLDALGEVADSDPVVISALSLCAALVAVSALLIVAFWPMAQRLERER